MKRRCDADRPLLAAGPAGVFNSSCLSHICKQRAVPCQMAVGQLQTVGSFVMIRPASHTFAFAPEHVQAMQSAYEAVCAKLQLSMGSEDRVTELVGEKIIEVAKTGEHDADKLAARVLAEFGIENDGSLWRH
jgi:hypothetical protein